MPVTTTQKQETKKKILIVEDQGEIALVLDMALNKGQLDMDYVNTLLAADEYLQKQHPALIILDNKLPDGYGVDFIVYLKKKYPAIKIIMISGLTSARDVALQNGADMFFEKPFSLDEFEEAINNLLQ
jgi:two-component system, OmpR family, response regulator